MICFVFVFHLCVLYLIVKLWKQVYTQNNFPEGGGVVSCTLTLNCHTLPSSNPRLSESFKSHFVQRKMSTQKWRPNIKLYIYYSTWPYRTQNKYNATHTHLYIATIIRSNTINAFQTECWQVVYYIMHNVLDTIFRFFAYDYQNEIHTDHVSHYRYLQYQFHCIKRKMCSNELCESVQHKRLSRTHEGCWRTGQKNRFAKGGRAVERKRSSAYYTLSISLCYPHTLTYVQLYGLCIFRTNKGITYT